MHREEDMNPEPTVVDSRFRPPRWLMALVCLILIGLYAGTIAVLGYYVDEESHPYPFCKKVEQAKENIAHALAESAAAWDDVRQELDGEVSQETLEKFEACDAGMAAVRRSIGREFGNIHIAEDDYVGRMNKMATIPLIASAGAAGFVMLLLSILLIAAARPAAPVSDWEWQKKHYRKA